MDEPADARTGLASVLRRLAIDAQFATAVATDPESALARYRLSGNDLAALALWLDEPAARHGRGLDALFDPAPDDPAPR